MDVRLPNGQLITGVPDDVSQRELAKIAVSNGLAKESDFDFDFDESDGTTALGSTAEFFKGIPRGFLSSFATGAEGLGQLADKATDFIGLENLVDSGEDNELIRLARIGQEKVDATFGADPRYRDKWTTKFGDALGSLGSFLVPGGALKALGYAGKVQAAATAPLAMGLGAGEQSQRMEAARQQGLEVTPEDEYKAIFGGAFIGLSELAPVHKILKGMKADDLFDEVGELKPFAQTWLPRLKSALSSGSAEAVQEVSAGFAQDALEKGLYNENLEMGQTAWDEFTLGGAAGMTADLVMNSIIGRRSRGISDQETERERQARENEQRHFEERRKGVMGGPAMEPLALPPVDITDPEVRSDPERYAQELTTRHVQALGENFPLNTAFTVDPETMRVVDSGGIPYGPRFETVDQAAIFAGTMNEAKTDLIIDRQTDTILEQSTEVAPENEGVFRRFARRLFHPDHNVISAEELNYAAGTVAEEGFGHEGMNLEEALNAGIKPKDMTAVQQENYRRIKAGRPQSNTFSVADAQRILGDRFQRLNEFRYAKLDPDERFKAQNINGQPVVVSNRGEVVDTRRKNLFERADTDSRMARRPFRSLQEAKDHADFLNDRVAKGTVKVADLRDPERITTEDFKRLLKEKNVESDINSEEVRQVARNVLGNKAGGKRFQDMTPSEKSLVYQKFRALPKLAKRGKLPVFKLKPYSPAHLQLVRNAGIELAAAKDIPVTRKELPSREDVASAAGPITQEAYDALMRDVVGSERFKNDVQAARDRAKASAEEIRAARTQGKKERERIMSAIREALKGYGLERFAVRLSDWARQVAVDPKTGETLLGPEMSAQTTDRNTTRGAFFHALNEIFIYTEAQKQTKSYQKLVRDGAPEEVLLDHLARKSVDALNHEILHAMRQADLFTQREWALLETTAKKHGLVAKAIEAYPELNPVRQMEEAVAELVRKGLAGELSIGGPQKNLINRILEFFRGMLGLQQRGYGDPASIIEAIRSGEIGARQEGVIRTLRATEKELADPEYEKGELVRPRMIPRRPGFAPTSGAPLGKDDPGVAKALKGQAVADAPPVPVDTPLMRSIRDQVPGFEELQKQAGVSDASFMRSVERARKQGFDVTTVWYVGTAGRRSRRTGNINQWNQGVPKIWLTTDPYFAARFAGFPGKPEKWWTSEQYLMDYEPGTGGHIYPMFIRVKSTFDVNNPEHIEAILDQIYDKSEEDLMEMLEEYLAEKGMEGLIADYEGFAFSVDTFLTNAEVYGPDSIAWQQIEPIAPLLEMVGFDSYVDYEYAGGPATGIALFDGSNAKSIFAKFDPESVPKGKRYGDDMSFMRGTIRSDEDLQAAKSESRRAAETFIRARLNRAAAERRGGRSQAPQFDRKEGRGTYQGVRVLGVYEPSRTYLSTIREAGVAPVELLELDGGADRFLSSITKAKEASPWGAAVYVYPESEYANMRLFLSPNQRYGFAIKQDGDIVSVFSDGGRKAYPMLALAVEQGGTKLDAFDTVLPYLYAEAGFREVGRDRWNDEYAPEGWSKEQFKPFNNGEPDVVYMEYDAAYSPYEDVQADASFMRSEVQPPELGSESAERIVAENEAAERLPPAYGVPEFSSRASPEAQYIARHPEAAPDTKDLDMSFMRPPKVSGRLMGIMGRVTAAPPSNRHPMNAYNSAVGNLKPSLLNYWLTKAKQETVFSHAQLERYYVTTDLKDLPGNSSAMAAVLNHSRSMGLAASAVTHGVPVYHNGWLFVVNKSVAEKMGLTSADLGFDLDEVKSLIEINAPLYSKEYGDLTQVAQTYAIARRAARLRSEGKKVPITQAEEAAVMQEIDSLIDHKTGENIIKRWYKDWQFYNERVINMMERAGILNDETAQLWRDQADYYPFYRVAEGAEGPQWKKVGERVFGGMTKAVGLRKLRGGETPINLPLLDAMTLNMSAAIQMSLKNIAQQRITRDMVNLGLARTLNPGEGATQGGWKIDFRVDGKAASAEIFDPLVYQSMLPLEGTDFVATVRKTFGFPATALRELVTRDPGFMLVNLIRDTLSASVTSGAGLTPVLSTVKGLFDGIEKLESLGVVGGYDYSNDPDDIVKFWKRQLRKRGVNPDGNMDALGMFRRAWDFFGTGTTASDAATRNAVWNRVYQQTGDIAEASMQAMEVINFGRHGRNPLMRVMTAVIPFLNARIQGVDVFWRAFTGRYSAKRHNHRGLIAASALLRASILSSSTLAYFLLVGDDDQYKDAPGYVKDSYWLFPTKMGVPFRLPIPFEVGLFFKTIPEAVLARLMSGVDESTPGLRGDLARMAGAGGKYDIRSGKEVKETLERGLGSTLENPIVNPATVQFIGPLLEASMNFDTFTGRPIVPQYLMDGREAGAQGEVWTNEMAKWIGKKFNISPLKVEHVMEGYAGTIGTYFLNMIDASMKSEYMRGDNTHVMPERPWHDYGVIRRFFGKLNDRGLMQEAYELHRETKRVYDTYMNMHKEGRSDEAEAYIQNRQVLLGLKGSTEEVKKFLDEMREWRDLVLRSDLSGEEKRRQIDEIETQINEVLRQVVPELEEMADMPFFDTYYRGE